MARVVFFVRHAEREVLPVADPPLSPSGTLRAEELARLLAVSGVKKIYTSTLLRSIQTAKPTADALALQPEPHATENHTVAALKKHSDNALVVGHSNTISPMIEALGGPSIKPIGEFEFDNLYVLFLSDEGPATLAYLKYRGSLPAGSRRASTFQSRTKGGFVMSVKLDKELEKTGTRFRIFVQPRFLPSFREPEVIWVSTKPEDMQPGPADHRMYVVDAIHKTPYNRFTLPPYTGPFNPPVKASDKGHFDHLDPNSREFSCATMFATVRRVLDIWEDYFGRELQWHFSGDFDRLELIPLIEWDNAQSGYGFLEFGFGRKPNGAIDRTLPYCENFDVLAHEVGHSIIFAEVGFPTNPEALDPAIDYGGMHESAGDLVAIVAALHSDKVVSVLLNESCGNLFTVNELDRVGELSASREIRVAFNSVRMSDVGDEPHDRSVPLTGAIFDVMVEVFQKNLVEAKLINQDLADRSTQGPGGSPDLDAIAKDFKTAYEGHHDGFKDALLRARDYLGALLAKTWSNLSPDFLTYHGVLRALLRADRLLDEQRKGKHQKTIRECFAWREISPSPALLLQSHRRLQACGLGPSMPPAKLSEIDKDHRRRPVGPPAESPKAAATSGVGSPTT